MDKKPRKKRKNDSLINYLLIGLIALLVIVLIAYVVSAFFSGNNTDDNRLGTEQTIETQDPNTIEDTQDEVETGIQTINEGANFDQDDNEDENAIQTQQETVEETVVETQQDTVQETVQETVVETQQDTVQETVVETQQETAQETVVETQQDTVQETEVETMREIVYTNSDNSFTVTNIELQTATQEELIDMIVGGRVGYGRERLEILEANGIDYEEIREQVTQRMRNMQ